MAANTIWGYISFGKSLEKLNSIKPSEGKPVEDISRLLSDWEEFDPEVPTFSVYKKLDKLLNEWGESSNLPLNKQEYEQVKELLIRFDTTLELQMARISVYPLRKDIQADRDKIIDNLVIKLGHDIYYHLPQNLRDNLVQSGQCLALELPIGASMLAFRCAEAVLKRYYDLIEVIPPRNEEDTFGFLIKNLREWNNKQWKTKQPNKVRKDLVAFVSTIPPMRNDTMHNPDHDDDPLAEGYWENCLRAIRQMGLDLEKRRLLEKFSQNIL